MSSTNQDTFLDQATPESSSGRAKRRRYPENAWEVPPSPNAQAPIQEMKRRLLEDRVTRLGLIFLGKYEDVHLKDVLVDWTDDERRTRINGREVVNFGSDSLLGLDRDSRIQKALVDGLKPWGTHNGASRAFSSVALCEEAEYRLARWLGVEETLIFPSVSLANMGALPALVGKGDLLIVDRTSHDTLHQGAKIAAQDGCTVRELHPCDGETLRKILRTEDYEGSVIAVDGVYSMTGKVPPLAELKQVAVEFGAVLYVDDAHGTAVVGPNGRGAAVMTLGSLDDILMVGSLSKAFSCLGAFVTCDLQMKLLLKLRSSTFIFGGPVPPPYLAAICAACDILESPEYPTLLARLHENVQRLTAGIKSIGLIMSGGVGAVIAITVGDLEKTLLAGKRLFDRGYYVQSATYPAVPIMEGILRIQVNANHTKESIDGLLEALADLKLEFNLPGS